MNYQKNYHDDDLKVWFVNCDEGEDTPQKANKNSTYYPLKNKEVFKK